MPSNHLILCHPLLLLPSIFPSIRVFSNESVFHIRWPKYWSFSFSISPSNEYSGLIFFRTDWFDLCVVQRTLKSLLQHHSSKASILWCSAFFMVQLSHPYISHTYYWNTVIFQKIVESGNSPSSMKHSLWCLYRFWLWGASSGYFRTKNINLLLKTAPSSSLCVQAWLQK